MDLSHAIAVLRPGSLPAGFAGVGSIGFGAVAQHVVAAAIAQRVEMNRGLAAGVGTSGSTAGQLALMPLLAILMQGGHWRASFALLALACALLIPVAWLVNRSVRARTPRQWSS